MGIRGSVFPMLRGIAISIGVYCTMQLLLSPFAQLAVWLLTSAGAVLTYQTFTQKELELKVIVTTAASLPIVNFAVLVMQSRIMHLVNASLGQPTEVKVLLVVIFIYAFSFTGTLLFMLCTRHLLKTRTSALQVP